MYNGTFLVYNEKSAKRASMYVFIIFFNDETFCYKSYVIYSERHNVGGFKRWEFIMKHVIYLWQ